MGENEGTTPAQQAVVKLLELREEGGGPLEGEFGGNDRRKGNAEAERELDKRVWVRTKGQTTPAQQAVVKSLELREEGGRFGGNDRRKGKAEVCR